MLKLFLFLIVLAVHIIGEDKVEIYASTMNTKDNIVTADEDVVVIYQDYHISAKKAVYNRNNADLELFGNIRAVQGENIKILGEYAKLNIAQKERVFKPFYLLEQKSDVWLSGAKGYAKEDYLSVRSGITSGCDPEDPLWRMEFTSSDYNAQTMWLNLYNTRIYIYDIPVFYTPYFGYSLDTTRRTGLLPPMIGMSDKEGFYYEQPLFIAEDDWWDLELKPQVRTNRGVGVYGTFRFVDSNISKGFLSGGYFREKENYFVQNELANQKHYGFNFLYENSDVINQWVGTNYKGQSGLYIDIVNMNDIDYINLSTNDTTKNATATQLLSRINLFYNTDTNYLGAYFKYYKDLTLGSNEETLQNIPSIHYHKYLDNFLNNHFFYNIDIKSNNYYRTLGKSAVQTDINIPLTFQTQLFDEYMNLSYESYIYAQHTAFRGETKTPTTDEYNSGIFARNYHSVSLSSHLTKAYDEVTHVLDFGAQYQVAGSEIESGYYEEQKNYCSQSANKTKAICEFYNITDIEEKLELYFSHYLYDSTGREVLYHRLSQNISYEKVDGGVGELENELDYQITNSINFYNNMFFNYDENAFSKNFNKITYSNKSFDAALSYMYKNSFIDTIPNTSYMTSSINYRYDNHYSYNFRLDYDLENRDKKSFEIGFLYQKRCWDFGITYLENNRPILNQNGVSDSIYDRYIYLTIRLKPMMKPDRRLSGFVYRLPETN
mgnify:CR=1 FL=1